MPKEKKPTVVDVLKRMKALLRKGWTQEAAARNELGKAVPSRDATAVRFCLIGAEVRASHELAASFSVNSRVETLVRMCTNGSVAGFNDAKGRKKSEIIAVVDCAIKKAVEVGN